MGEDSNEPRDSDALSDDDERFLVEEEQLEALVKRTLGVRETLKITKQLRTDAQLQERLFDMLLVDSFLPNIKAVVNSLPTPECEGIRKHFGRHIAGTSSAAETARVNAHLASCAPCETALMMEEAGGTEPVVATSSSSLRRRRIGLACGVLAIVVAGVVFSRVLGPVSAASSTSRSAANESATARTEEARGEAPGGPLSRAANPTALPESATADLREDDPARIEVRALLAGFRPEVSVRERNIFYGKLGRNRAAVPESEVWRLASAEPDPEQRCLVYQVLAFAHRIRDASSLCDALQWAIDAKLERSVVWMCVFLPTAADPRAKPLALHYFAFMAFGSSKNIESSGHFSGVVASYPQGDQVMFDLTEAAALAAPSDGVRACARLATMWRAQQLGDRWDLARQMGDMVTLHRSADPVAITIAEIAFKRHGPEFTLADLSEASPTLTDYDLRILNPWLKQAAAPASRKAGT